MIEKLADPRSGTEMLPDWFVMPTHVVATATTPEMAKLSIEFVPSGLVCVLSSSHSKYMSVPGAQFVTTRFVDRRAASSTPEKLGIKFQLLGAPVRLQKTR